MAEQIKLKDITLMWAKLDTVDDLSGKYQVELTNLTAEHVQAISGLGIEVKNSPNKPEKGFFLTAKSTKPITALDASGGILKQKIGNGSKANILLTAYPWAFKNKKGISPSIAKMVVTHVEVFEGSGGSAPDDDDDLL